MSRSTPNASSCSWDLVTYMCGWLLAAIGIGLMIYSSDPVSPRGSWMPFLAAGICCTALGGSLIVVAVSVPDNKGLKWCCRSSTRSPPSSKASSKTAELCKELLSSDEPVYFSYPEHPRRNGHSFHPDIPPIIPRFHVSGPLPSVHSQETLLTSSFASPCLYPKDSIIKIDPLGESIRSNEKSGFYSGSSFLTNPRNSASIFSNQRSCFYGGSLITNPRTAGGFYTGGARSVDRLNRSTCSLTWSSNRQSIHFNDESQYSDMDDSIQFYRETPV